MNNSFIAEELIQQIEKELQKPEDDGLINRNPGDILNWAQNEFGNVALDHSFSKDLFILVIYK